MCRLLRRPNQGGTVNTTEPDPGWTFLPAPPRPPAHCAGCGVELSAERAGRNTRCPPCWDELLAAQPGEAS